MRGGQESCVAHRHRIYCLYLARYEYDDNGHLVRVTDADDYSWTYGYDEFNRLVRDTDRAGLSFCFRYDNQDRGIEAWGEYIGKRDPSLADDLPTFLHDGQTRAKGIYHRKFDYRGRGYTEVTDTTETRRYFGNAKGMLDRAVTGGAVTSSVYDERGFEVERTDPMQATTRWRRDERGRVLEVVDPLGRRTQIERDARGLPVLVVDAAGATTRAWRDQRGNVETLRDATGSATHFYHDARGLVTVVTDARGSVRRYAYDTHGNMVEFTQPNGGRWMFAYDALGRRLSVRDPMAAETRYAYSDRGDLVATYDAAGGVTRYSYDGERHLTQIVGPKGQVTQFTWGGFHKVCARNDANGSTVRLAYNREGELVAVYNERLEVHRFIYDSAGRLLGEDTFDGRKLRYRNDIAGRAVRIENGAGEITRLTYDAAGQLVARELADETLETFEYDARGELVRAANAAGEIHFARDTLGRIVREVQRVDEEEHWIDVTYDNSGRRLRRQTSLGHAEDIQRDETGARITTILDGRHQVKHANDMLGREIARTLGGDGVIQSAFDAMGRLAQRLVRSPVSVRPAAREPEWLGRREDGVTAATTRQYDAGGELISKHDRARGVTRYDYDPTGQLVAVLPERGPAEVFHYDRTGNVHEGGGDASDRVYGAGDRLLRKGRVEYAWDDDGRLSRATEHGSGGDRVWTYAWNGAGLLAEVTTPDGRRVAFTYDPLARRLSKEVRERDGLAWKAVQRTRFVWDGDVLVHELRLEASDAGDPVIAEKTYCFEDGSFVPAAHRDAPDGEWFHYVTDSVGSPESLVDQDGQIACDLERDAWGEMRIRPGARTRTPIRLPGQWADDETGTAFNRWRTFDLGSGRYLSPDPLGLRGGLNAYAYCRNPFTWRDPLGLTPPTPEEIAKAQALAAQITGMSRSPLKFA